MFLESLGKLSGLSPSSSTPSRLEVKILAISIRSANTLRRRHVFRETPERLDCQFEKVVNKLSSYLPALGLIIPGITAFILSTTVKVVGCCSVKARILTGTGLLIMEW